jgi:hypothetical protein
MRPEDFEAPVEIVKPQYACPWLATSKVPVYTPDQQLAIMLHFRTARPSSNLHLSLGEFPRPYPRAFCLPSRPSARRFFDTHATQELGHPALHERILQHVRLHHLTTKFNTGLKEGFMSSLRNSFSNANLVPSFRHFGSSTSASSARRDTEIGYWQVGSYCASSGLIRDRAANKTS